jgi:thiol:disulfide interchange protein DsbD
MKHLFALILLSSLTLSAQLEIVDGKIVQPQNAYQPGQSATFLFAFTIAEGWHINAHITNDPYVIPTTFAINNLPAGLVIGKIRYPEPERKKFAFSDNILPVFEERQYLAFSLSVDPGLLTGSYKAEALFSYQGCNDATCLAPFDLVVPFEIVITDDASKVITTNASLIERHAPPIDQLQPVRENTGDNELDQYYQESLWLYLLFVFIAGLGLNLTPCVFPLIPITISYFANKSGGKQSGLIGHGLLYALGMAITYSLLGTFAALAGGIIGSILQRPEAIIAIVLLILALAASMFGLFEITVPAKLAQIGGKNRGGYGGTLLMGLTVGIIAAPCIGPFVLALVTYVAQAGNWFFGFISFFTLAMGLGLPYAVLAVFSSRLNQLPQAGAWMVFVRQVFGFILVALAVYFLQPLLGSDALSFALIATTLLCGSLFLLLATKKHAGLAVRAIAAAILIIAATYFADLAHTEYQYTHNASAVSKANWKSYDSDVIEQAVNDAKPVFIDFYADWCEPCKEMERSSFRDPRFITISEKFVMVKADLTDAKDPLVNSLRSTFSIRGVPTIVLIAPDGEIRTTLVGFQDANALIGAMQKIVETD